MASYQAYLVAELSSRITELKALVAERERIALTDNEGRVRDTNRMIVESRELLRRVDTIIGRASFRK